MIVYWQTILQTGITITALPVVWATAAEVNTDPGAPISAAVASAGGKDRIFPTPKVLVPMFWLFTVDPQYQYLWQEPVVPRTDLSLLIRKPHYKAERDWFRFYISYLSICQKSIVGLNDSIYLFHVKGHNLV